MKKKIYVHIADDHKILIEGLTALIHTDNQLKVKGYSLNGREVIEWFKKNEAHILILDISMPEVNGIEVLTYFKQHGISQKVIVLSSYDEVNFVKEILDLGVLGYISKASAGQHIIEAIKTVHEGKQFFSDNIKENMVNLLMGYETDKGDRPDDVYDLEIISQLSERELDVLKLIAKEYSTQEISEMLNLGLNTVKTHRKKLFTKLNVKNVVGLGKFAIKNRLI